MTPPDLFTKSHTNCPSLPSFLSVQWHVMGTILGVMCFVFSRGRYTHRAKFQYIHLHRQCFPPPFQLRLIVSLSWVTPSTDVIYNRASTPD